VSVPQGIGANRTDGHSRRLLRFAPPTPPWRRQAQNEGIKESMTLSREPLELRTGCYRAHLVWSKFRSCRNPRQRAERADVSVSV
jgi:hypothetical protein